MKFFLRTTLISILVSLLLLDSFAQTPSVQWVRELPNPTKSYTVNYITNLTSYETKSTGFFALENDVALGYTTPILYKFGASGEITWQKSLSECSNVKACAKYDVKATNDGGLLLLDSWFGTIAKYSQTGNTEWSIAIDRRLYSSLPTSVASNDIFFTVTDMLNQQVSCYAKTGKLLWGMTLENTIVNLQATDDNGVILLTSSGMLKLSSTGQIQWQNNTIEEQIKLINANYFCAKSTTSISMFSLINGNRVWSYPITGVNDFSVTADKQIAFVTNNKTVKLSMDKVEVLSHNNGGNQLVATSDSALIVRNGIQSIFKCGKNNQITWSKTMVSTSNSALKINSSIDGGIFITGYHNYFSAYKNTSFVGKIVPDSKPCDYDVAIFHTASSSKVCKTDTLKLNLSNYPLTLGSAELLTTDFKIQWKRNKIAIPNATNITYIATESGSYEVTVSQGENCSVTSPAFTIDVLNASKPSITASINPVCEGVATTLTSTCSSDANVWSTGEKTSTLTFTPKTASTAITVYCAEKYSVGDSVKTCIGANSEPYIITSYTNDLVAKIIGNTMVCGTKPTLLGTTITGGKSPYQYNWEQNLKTLSQSNQLSVADGGTYTL
nr:PQQ-binding-like beta-propeller repeat protein [Flectobacillus sp.]